MYFSPMTNTGIRPDDLFVPAVDAAVWHLRPDFAALSVVVRGGRNLASDESSSNLSLPSPPPWADAHMDAWRQAYSAFGAKPQRTPCSAEALRRRVERDGALPRINVVVDLDNLLSLQYALPVGGENLAAYVGAPRLVRAEGVETFETTREGQPATEIVTAGEVVWRDDQGVTCRRWNWRQTVRTRLDVDSTDMWFVLERLEPMPVASLREAGESLIASLLELAPDARIATTLIANPETA